MNDRNAASSHIMSCYAGRQGYLDNIERIGGKEALEQFIRLEKEMEPLQQARRFSLLGCLLSILSQLPLCSS